MSNPAENTRELRRIDEAAPYAAIGAALIGAGGVIAGVLSGFSEGWDVFFRAYLLNYCYVLSLSLGALFFVLLQHLTRAGWSVAVRRLAELVAGTLPVLALLFLPVLIPVLTGREGVYEWTNAQRVAEDKLLQGKHAYLNVPFFIVRCVVYFTIWVLLARYFLKRSVAQDTSGDVNLTLRMQWWSAPGMLLFALTSTFFAIDVLMSLNPHWYSTIFGVYFYSGCVVGFFALLPLLAYGVQRIGRLTRSITIEHYHDLGKLAFAFVVFWAYIAFSQYMLIWYGNIPEETVWFQVRQAGNWWIGVSLLLLFGHFCAPFLMLIARYPKRRPGLLVLACAWLLLMHWLDLYYLVVPRAQASGARPAPLHVADVALLVGLGGLFLAALLRLMARHTLLPERDPRLAESLAFENV